MSDRGWAVGTGARHSCVLFRQMWKYPGSVELTALCSVLQVKGVMRICVCDEGAHFCNSREQRSHLGGEDVGASPCPGASRCFLHHPSAVGWALGPGAGPGDRGQEQPAACIARPGHRLPCTQRTWLSSLRFSKPCGVCSLSLNFCALSVLRLLLKTFCITIK